MSQNEAPKPRAEQPPVEPAAGTPAGAVADELFAHGLLSVLSKENTAASERRMGRLMEAIAADQGSERRLKLPLVWASRWIAAAAVLVLGVGTAIFILSTGPSAQAVVRESIVALRAGDRRYEVRLMRESDTALSADPTAVVDMRDGGLLLIRARGPEGRGVTVGRDEQGDWAIRRDGGIEREHPEIAWPRWASVGDKSLFADSVDRLLEVLSKSYTLERRGTEELEGHAGKSYEHLVGEKKNRPQPGADRIELWIDHQSKLLERLEMRWDSHDGPPRDRPPPPRPRWDRPPPDGDDRPEPPPWFPVGPPPRGMDERPRPPKLLVLERTEAPTFEPGWFNPGTHASE